MGSRREQHGIEKLSSTTTTPKHKTEEKMKSYLATVLTLLCTLELGSAGHYYRSRPSKRVFNSLVSDGRFSTLVADVPALTEILLRHVVPGKTVKLYKAPMSYDDAGGSKVTVNGYKVSTSATSAMVTGKVTATDGMVYAIDTVI